MRDIKMTANEPVDHVTKTILVSNLDQCPLGVAGALFEQCVASEKEVDVLVKQLNDACRRRDNAYEKYTAAK